MAVRKSAAPHRFPWTKALLGGALVALGLVFGHEVAMGIPSFATEVDRLHPWGPVVFVAGYAVTTVLFVPASLLTLAAGAVFGLVQGALYVFVGATTGAAMAFLVSRHVARSAVERRLEGNDRMAAIDGAIGSRGYKIVLLLRLSPVFPFVLLNYALGLTRVPFRDYLLASVGMLPGTLLYVYYGKLIGDVAAMAGGVAVPRGVVYYAVLTFGMAATVVATTLVTRAARRALRDLAPGIEPLRVAPVRAA